MTTLMSFRVDDDLKKSFTKAAISKQQSQSDAIREALLLYIKRVRNEELQAAAVRIRGNRGDEEDALHLIDIHQAGADD
ncbi:ribbon-helix-helix protein, CopG family [Pararhizobium arenae]|uniref:ribbon-helix-helix protein, CopG family n=1 Tax=Pararhizobium arenae TaxID=1856850 RepID=UPI00094AADD4|nr:ribbon-helix-helix protein, CopG family [Pararhizobium arenae]